MYTTTVKIFNFIISSWCLKKSIVLSVFIDLSSRSFFISPNIFLTAYVWQVIVQEGTCFPSFCDIGFLLNHMPYLLKTLPLKLLLGGLSWWSSGWEYACQCRGHGFDSWFRKIPHAVEQLSPWATTTEPVLWSPRTTTAEARVPRAHAQQQEKPPQLEACAPQWRVAPAHCN